MIPLAFNVNSDADINSIYENYDRFIKEYINDSEIRRLRSNVNQSEVWGGNEIPHLIKSESKPGCIKIVFWFIKKYERI